MPNTVFITGASTGIGRDTARLFLASGWNVVATMRTPSSPCSVASRLRYSANSAMILTLRKLLPDRLFARVVRMAVE